MEVTDEMVAMIRRKAALVEYGDVTIMIKAQGNDNPYIDVATTVCERFLKKKRPNAARVKIPRRKK